MHTETTPSFGEQLKGYRLAAGLTQEALAERAGVSARGIQALENGESKPQRETARRLAAALGLPQSAHPAFLAAAGPAPRRRAVAERLPPAAPPSPRLRPADPGSQPPLAGRRREVALLEAHLAGTGPPVLVLAGEPGIGKSRLLQHVAQQAQERDWWVLVGGCQRRGGQAPYAPLLEALERHIRSRSRA
jgi:transcriptional regulator with XRE-family HTH domain